MSFNLINVCDPASKCIILLIVTFFSLFPVVFVFEDLEESSKDRDAFETGFERSTVGQV